MSSKAAISVVEQVDAGWYTFLTLESEEPMRKTWRALIGGAEHELLVAFDIGLDRIAIRCDGGEYLGAEVSFI